jgi:hypothetical protein
MLLEAKYRLALCMLKFKSTRDMGIDTSKLQRSASKNRLWSFHKKLAHEKRGHESGTAHVQQDEPIDLTICAIQPLC